MKPIKHEFVNKAAQNVFSKTHSIIKNDVFVLVSKVRPNTFAIQIMNSIKSKIDIVLTDNMDRLK